MKISLGKEDFLEYVISQIRTFFPDKNLHENELKKYSNDILYRTEFCFSKINSKYFSDGNDIILNHLNADQYAMFLYFAANTLFRNNSDTNFCTKLFQLNRYLHGIDVYYEVELPDIFLFVHPIGTVLGRAKYSNYFLVYQRCNVGGSADCNERLIYPECQEHLTMHPGSVILGNCKVEKNCTMAAGALLLNRNLNANSLYIGNPRDYIIKPRDKYHYAWKRNSNGGCI